jgi:hypothetical protein
MHIPKREVTKLQPIKGTRSIEVVSCQEENTCNLQIMFEKGLRISVPIEAGDTRLSLKDRIVKTVSDFRPYSAPEYSYAVELVSKGLSDAMCGENGKVQLITMRVANLIPQWEVNLLWDFLVGLQIPVEYDEAMEVLEELGLPLGLEDGEHGGPDVGGDDAVGVEPLGALERHDGLLGLGPDDPVGTGGTKVEPMVDEEPLDPDLGVQIVVRLLR